MIEPMVDRKGAAGGTMRTFPGAVTLLVRKPSAFIPMAMSFCALAIVVGSFALHGTGRESDEGAAAHVWQILMAGQLPFLAWFLLRWTRRDPIASAAVIGIQIAAIGGALFPVWYYGL